MHTANSKFVFSNWNIISKWNNALKLLKEYNKCSPPYTWCISEALYGVKHRSTNSSHCKCTSTIIDNPPRATSNNAQDLTNHSIVTVMQCTIQPSSAHSIQTTVYIKPQRTVCKKVNCHPTQDLPVARKLTTIGILWLFTKRPVARSSRPKMSKNIHISACTRNANKFSFTLPTIVFTNPLHTAVHADTKTHALIDNKVQASSKDVLVQLGIHLPLTTECIIGLIAGGARTNSAVTVNPFTIRTTILVLGWFTA